MGDETQPANAWRMLVIDDDPGTASIVRSWYGDEPVTVLDARTGEDGVRLAAADRFDLVLLDMRMPGMDGLATARKLRELPSTRTTPIILLTACRAVEDKVRAFEAGADDYITKPFEFEEVDARIRTMLATRRRMQSLESTVQSLQSTNEQLEELLVVDEKTGLYNFRFFQRKLREEWQRAERYGTPLSLVFFDLDNFKGLNDSIGHPLADRVLQEFATLVAGGARQTDTAARYGGEEFAMILPHTDGPMAMRVAERIRAAVADFPFLADESPTRITVSGGVATMPAPGIDHVDALLRAADRALYRAKDSGRNAVVQDWSDGETNDRGKPDHDAARRAPTHRMRRAGRGDKPASTDP